MQNQSLAFQKKWRTQLSVMAIDAGKVEKEKKKRTQIV